MEKITKKLILAVCGLILSQLSYADSYETVYDSKEVDGIYYLFDSSSATATVTYKYKVMRTYLEECDDGEDTWYEETVIPAKVYIDE